MTRRYLKFIVIIAALGGAGIAVFSDWHALGAESVHTPPDPAKARAAFTEASKVFFSARCMNCHPSGDTPLQGDSNSVHANDIVRGPKGRGSEELQCNICHQETNTEGEGMPPGVPDWHMPGPDMKMSFQGLTASQLCLQLKDPLRNGGRKLPKEAVQHISTDPKVLWAWEPGNNRTKPPLSKADFLKKMDEWLANGADCPK